METKVSEEDKERNERGEGLFPSPSSLPPSLSAVTLTGPVIGRGPLSFFFSFALSLPRGSAPQREPWGPEIADDKIAAAFHSAQGYPPRQPNRGVFA